MPAGQPLRPAADLSERDVSLSFELWTISTSRTMAAGPLLRTYVPSYLRTLGDRLLRGHLGLYAGALCVEPRARLGFGLEECEL